MGCNCKCMGEGDDFAGADAGAVGREASGCSE